MIVGQQWIEQGKIDIVFKIWRKQSWKNISWCGSQLPYIGWGKLQLPMFGLD